MIDRLVSLCAALLVVTACAGAPVQEMSDARQALRAAEEADAARHSPEPLLEAQALLERAEFMLGSGAYGEARRLALDARALAIRAREQALTSGPP